MTRDPKDEMDVSTVRLNPWMMLAIATTVATPITTPSVVSSERRPWARSDTSEMPARSRAIARRPRVGETARATSLIRNAALRSGPVSPRGRRGRNPKHADQGGEQQAENDRERAHEHGQRRDDTDEKGEHHPECEPHEAAEARQGHGLDQELNQDVAPAGPERLANAD